jgi:hypothetical protein
LENLINSANDLLHAPIGQTDNATPITTTYVLLICYVALKMLELPQALQYVDQWRTLFRIFTDLGNHSLDITPRIEPTSSLANDVNAQSSPQPNPVPSTIQPAQFTGVESEQVQKLVKLCLQDVQRHDVLFLGPRSGDNPTQYLTAAEIDKVYKDWLLLFKLEHSIIEDEFVKMLGRIFKLATLDNPDDEDKLQYFRLRKLGILESNRAGSAQAVDHDTAPTNNMQNHGFRNGDDRDVGDATDDADGEQSLPVE